MTMGLFECHSLSQIILTVPIKKKIIRVTTEWASATTLHRQRALPVAFFFGDS